MLPTFRVRNLGPITEGTVQLHPLTILIGKNNTGKTYMAQAIYAAHKALETANGPTTPFITLEESDDLLQRLQFQSEDESDILNGPLRLKAEGWMRSRLKRVGDHLENRLSVYFDLDHIDELKRWKSTGKLQVTAAIQGSQSRSVCLFDMNGDSTSDITLPSVTARDLLGTYVTTLLDDLVIEVPGEQRREQSEMIRRRASTGLAEVLWDTHLLPSIGLSGVAHYLPAGRSGLLEAWTDVVRLRLEQDRDNLVLTGREPAALGGIALDFLLELQELIRPGRRRYRRSRARHPVKQSTEEVRSAAVHLEKLIGGRVELERGRERVPSFTYTHGSNSIPVQRASSMVAELAPLLSWTNHLLIPGDLLLIDEPEAHMHPDAVVRVAQTLVALSRSGIRVLCTTHSADFLHKVSNCMLRSNLSGETESSDNTSIRAADIGVFRFERSGQSGGTVVVPVNIDPDWGIPEDEHVAVAELLADETAELVNSR